MKYAVTVRSDSVYKCGVHNAITGLHSTKVDSPGDDTHRWLIVNVRNPSNSWGVTHNVYFIFSVIRPS